MELVKPELLSDFADFSRQMIETRDYDPNYFAVKGVAESRGYDESATYDFCVTFNGFYHFKSADSYFQDPRQDVKLLNYGKSRRGFMGNEKVKTFLWGMKELKKFVLNNQVEGIRGWNQIYWAFSAVPGCGPWSAFYLTDMMKVILGKKITSPNFGHLIYEKANRGPNSGICFLTGLSIDRVAGNEELHQKVYHETLEAGAPWSGMEEMESVLCNFLSLHKKSYYVGRDIDRQLPMLAGLGEEWFAARSKYFPAEALGEIGGWTGIRKELMGTYERNKSWK